MVVVVRKRIRRRKVELTGRGMAVVVEMSGGG